MTASNTLCRKVARIGLFALALFGILRFDRVPGRCRRADAAESLVHAGRRAVLPAGTAIPAKQGSRRTKGHRTGAGATAVAKAGKKGISNLDNLKQIGNPDGKNRFESSDLDIVLDFVFSLSDLS